MRRLILVLLLSTVVFSLLNMPLRQVLRVVELPPGLVVSGLQGTLRSGQVEQLGYRGVAFEELRYALRPTCLLWFKLCYRLEDGNGDLRLNPGYSPWAGFTLEDTRLRLPVERLRPWLGKLLVQPKGELDLQLQMLELGNNRRLETLQAVLFWRKAGIEGESVVLGDFRADIEQEGPEIRLQLGDEPGALLGVEGEIRLGAEDFRVDVKLEARPGLGESARNALELMARRDGLNRYRIQRQGRLPQPIPWLPPRS